MARITLLTDFGTRDGYVAAMKGVIAGVFPLAAIDDVAHDLEPGDVDGAARALSRYWKLYPAGTVHVAVVDPGVGTGRRALAVEADRRFIVAPDNGLLTPVLRTAKRWRVTSIEDPRFRLPETSATFHGRDIFAPAAAYLARGVHISLFGPRVEDPVLIEEPKPVEREGEIVGEIVSADRFGNLITNLSGEDLEGAETVELAGRRLSLVRTYGEAAPLQPIALVNSEGRLEVAARDGSALEVLGAGVGTPVRVMLGTGGES
jgi:S-adenosyl-L-methionine hydrolase (adenosine-forming)